MAENAAGEEKGAVRRGRPARPACQWDGESVAALLAHLTRVTEVLERVEGKVDGLTQGLQARGSL